MAKAPRKKAAEKDVRADNGPPLRRRDPELVRLLLDDAEHGGDGRSAFKDRYAAETIDHHLAIVEDAEWIKAFTLTDSGSRKFYRLTWKGHDVLDDLRKRSQAKSAPPKRSGPKKARQL